VEELRRPYLKGKPFAVGRQLGERGVISSCSYAARSFGVHSAMPTKQALRICPQLIVVEPEHHAYETFSQKVITALKGFTPIIEKVSIDEAFLDLSDLSQDSFTIARQIQKRIWLEASLPCSIGVATNKLVAKSATDVGKLASKGNDYPRAFTVVPTGQEAAFLSGLPVRMLWGVGPKTAAALKQLGIHTIGELANYPQRELVQLLGKTGYDLASRALGIDDRPVIPERPIKSISQEITFEKDNREETYLQRTLYGLGERVAHRLRQEKLCCKTIRVKLRQSDFTTHFRQRTLSSPTDEESVILKVAEELFSQLWRPGVAVRLLGVGVGKLSSSVYQLNLWQTESIRERQLLSAIDELRERYGKSVVHRGLFIDNKHEGV